MSSVDVTPLCKMTVTIANILTASRIVIVPFFVACFVLDSRRLAILLFCVAGFTDLIDGTVARVLKQPSRAGAIMDPIADKLLLQSSFLALVLLDLLPLWFFMVALARDVMIVAGIIYLLKIDAALPYRPAWSSKLATLFQLAVAMLGLVRWWRPDMSIAGYDIKSLQEAAVVVAFVLIVLSGVKYVTQGLDILRRRRLKV